MIVFEAPPAMVAAAPIPSRNVVVWGDASAMQTLQSAFAAKGWRWATMLLGGQTPALMLIPPANVTEAEITQIIADLNNGKFGKLNGGYAVIGASNDQNGTTKS